jgi:hypothetical protein
MALIRCCDSIRVRDGARGSGSKPKLKSGADQAETREARREDQEAADWSASSRWIRASSVLM